MQKVNDAYLMQTNQKFTKISKKVFLNIFVCLLFNGISTFLGYLMPNPSFYKDSSGTI